MLFLIIACIIAACKTGANGRPEIDYEKARTSIAAAADAAVVAYINGADKKQIRQAALAAGNTALNTEPATDPIPDPKVSE